MTMVEFATIVAAIAVVYCGAKLREIGVLLERIDYRLSRRFPTIAEEREEQEDRDLGIE